MSTPSVDEPFAAFVASFCMAIMSDFKPILPTRETKRKIATLLRGLASNLELGEGSFHGTTARECSQPVLPIEVPKPLQIQWRKFREQSLAPELRHYSSPDDGTYATIETLQSFPSPANTLRPAKPPPSAQKQLHNTVSNPLGTVLSQTTLSAGDLSAMRPPSDVSSGGIQSASTWLTEPPPIAEPKNNSEPAVTSLAMTESEKNPNKIIRDPILRNLRKTRSKDAATLNAELTNVIPSESSVRSVASSAPKTGSIEISSQGLSIAEDRVSPFPPGTTEDTSTLRQSPWRGPSI